MARRSTTVHSGVCGYPQSRTVVLVDTPNYGSGNVIQFQLTKVFRCQVTFAALRSRTLLIKVSVMGAGGLRQSQWPLRKVVQEDKFVRKITAIPVVLAAVVTAACGSTQTSTTDAQSATTAPAGAAAGSSSAAASSSSNAPTSTAAKLQFPGKTVNVTVYGWDASQQMLLFRLAVSKKSPIGTASWVDDPSDPQTHRLSLASGASIRSKWVNCFDHSSGLVEGEGYANCTQQQLVHYLQATSTDQLYAAELRVDATDHIDRFTEYYHP